MDLGAFAKEVHLVAVEHGWWDDSPSLSDIFCMIQSEWNEALMEYREGRPLLWYRCKDVPAGDIEVCADGEYECDMYRDGEKCPFKSDKPEGIAVKLIDGCLRILDFLGKPDAKPDFPPVDEMINRVPKDIIGRDVPFTLQIMSLYQQTDYIYDCMMTAEIPEDLKVAYAISKAIIGYCFAWIAERGLDPIEIMLKKHEYNKTRPYRHGGKRI